MIDLYGHVFYISLLIGTFLLGRSYENGWLFRAVGSFGWTVVGVWLDLSSIYIWSTVFGFNDLYGYWRWKNGKDQNV